MLETQSFKSMHRIQEDVGMQQQVVINQVDWRRECIYVRVHLYCSLQTFGRLLDYAMGRLVLSLISFTIALMMLMVFLLASLLILESLTLDTGPRFFSKKSDFSEGCIPIFPKTEYWETVDGDKKTTHSRTMIPLWLSYAWTIWKAQGQTIKTKVVVVIGNTEKEHGLTYTAFSRVTRASDIGIDGGFPRNRLLEKVKKQRLMKERIKEEKRMDRKIIVPTGRKLRLLDLIPFWSTS